MSPPKVILCTGTNQGFEFGILDFAGLREPSSVYILACRSVASGHAAVKKLRDTGIFEVLQLDITHDDHILAAMKFVGAKYGKLDDEWIQWLLASY
ncbi:hypothetical protein ABVK25_008668 [Lepraria finkii]|uniref:Uncharacterized protein n=1 Tax=Lepraria finkii TaxID=1340010 RepID=A0ABR4AZK3_9LECA